MTQTAETTENNNLPVHKRPAKDKIAPVFISLIEQKAVKKTDKLFLYMHCTDNIRTAAKLAGLSESYAYKKVAQYKIDASLQDRIGKIIKLIPELYKQSHVMSLPRIHSVKMGALKKYEKDPELAIRHPKLLRDMEQIAGVIQEEGQAQATFNVDKMQVLIQHTLGTSETPPTVSSKDTAEEAEYIER